MNRFLYSSIYNRVHTRHKWRRGYGWRTADGGHASVASVIWALGKVEEFDPGTQNWTAYEERITQYFIANNVTGAEVEGQTDKRKVAVFLTLIGSKAYGILRDLVSPAKPAEKTYAQLAKILADHFSPKPVTISERFRFQQRTQREGESVSEYLAQLRKLTEHCKFADYLEQALRDRFVAGVRSAAIQRKLLSQEALTLEKALTIAQAMEAQSSKLRQATGLTDSVTT